MATLDGSIVFRGSELPISDDAHCQRVARLASEIGHRLALDARSLHILGEAAIQHHSPEFLLPRKGEQHCFGEEMSDCLYTLKVFHGSEVPLPGSKTTLLTEILHLADAFDEKFEWRIFESGPGSELMKELEDLKESGLWSDPVHQAFRTIFEGNRERAFAKAENLPLSAVSKIQKLALTASDDLTVSLLERIALADPVLTADLLRHVNSARFPIHERVSTVRQAIVSLGTIAARDVMLASAARGIFASSSLHRLWKHSVQCAIKMSALACQAGLDSHKAFLLGLLHDIGRISLECLDSMARSGYTKLCEVEAPAIWIEIVIAGCDHAELGADILASWNFPQSFTEIIRNHHSPELSTDKLTSLLYLVDATENDNEDLCSAARFTAALSHLEIGQEQVDQILSGDVLALAC